MIQEHNNTHYKFFWNGIFSNWYPSNFTISDITYNCGEQYMMYQKALLFKDYETANIILNTKHPKNQKMLGRKVKNYDQTVWDENKYELIKKGLVEKFVQNQDLLDELLKYRGYKIVEASPYDKILGIGYLDVDAIPNINNWGENLLGKMLTELSFELFYPTDIQIVEDIINNNGDLGLDVAELTNKILQRELNIQKDYDTYPNNK